MSKSVLRALIFSLLAFPALASTHLWLGTANNRVSDPANWSGGSPQNDPDAELVFDRIAARYDVHNDLPNLQFKRLVFPYQDYTFFGEPLLAGGESTISSTYGVKIYSDIRIDGTLTLSGTGPIELRGAISGPGPITIQYGETVFAGPAANTYTGDTTLGQEGSLTLKKDGVIALPGNLRSDSGFGSRLNVLAPNQIAGTATVSLINVPLLIDADVTMHALESSDGVGSSKQGPGGPVLTVDSLVPKNQITIDANLRLTQGVLELPANTGINVSGRVTVPDSGITLRGAANVSWGGDYTAPVKIEGARANLITPRSSVEMTSGSISGSVASLKASGGSIVSPLVSASDVRLGSGVTVTAYVSSVATPLITLNGTLDLGDATLDLLPTSNSDSAVIIRNNSTQPVVGTFKGVPEGGIALNRWRVTYHGGDGNDVAVTDLKKPAATIVITQNPKPAFYGEPLTLIATATGANGTPTGTVTFFRSGGIEIGSAPLVNGTASLPWTAPDAFLMLISYRYLGDATYASGTQTSAQIDVQYHKPSITSIEPATLQGGALNDIVIHGSGFVPGTQLSNGGSAFATTVISSSELRATIDLRSQYGATTLTFTALTPPPRVVSDPVTLTVAAAPHPPSTIQFDAHSASAPITPKGKSAWLCSEAFTYAAKFLFDDDGDGVVRWPMITPDAVFAVVDVTNGNYSLGGYGNAVPNPLPFPRDTFVKDAAGNFSSISLQPPAGAGFNWLFLWVRPGAGAWTMMLRDNEDDDRAANNIINTSVIHMLPLGDSPAHPSGFVAGDVLIVMPQSRGMLTPLFAARLGNELNDADPGVIQALYTNWSTFENQKAAHLTLIRTGGSTGPASVHYRTIDREDTAGSRYIATSGVATFAAGQVLAYIDIPFIDDTIYSGRTTFDVALSDPIGATLGERTDFVVDLSDDDPPPVIKIDGPDHRNVITRGDPITMQIGLSLEGATTVPVTVTWSVSGGTVSQSGMVVFAPGETSKLVSFTIPANVFPPAQILFDVPDAASRFVFIALDSETHARLTTSDVTVGENAGVAHVTVPVGNGVNWKTADGTAKSGTDYVAKSGFLPFDGAHPVQTIDIPILDNTTADGDRTFIIELTDNSPLLARKPVSVTIVDDETTVRPRLSIVDHVTVNEGTGLTTSGAEIRLSEPSTKPVRVRCSSANGSALADLDYAAIDTTITFAPGETTKTPPLTILGDMLIEGDETFTVTLSAAENATIENAQSVVTIVNDDTLPNHRRPGGH